MSSWVRYCVAVYVGMLISGALARPSMHYPSTTNWPASQPARYTPAYPATPDNDRDAPRPEPDAQAAAMRGACATLMA